MSILEYLAAIKERLLTDPIVADFQVIRERDTTTDGHIRARITLIDDGPLEFSEYFQDSTEKTTKKLELELAEARIKSAGGDKIER